MRHLIALILAGTLMAEAPAGSPFHWKPSPEHNQPAPASAPAPAPVVKKKSRKTTWIVIGAVAAGAAVGLIVVGKRLGNEGKGPFA